MNTVANKQMICEVLIRKAQTDPDIVVVCSDSRGSSSFTPFSERYPKQFIEVGIAEQNLVSISAGLARCGKKPFAASPASFLSTRSLEQIKVDVAYSATNVKLIGVSGGVSYGALGMTHHSLQDIAAISSIPGMRVYIPSDRFQTKYLIETIVNDSLPAYIRVGRNPVEDVYEKGKFSFEMNRAAVLQEGTDVTIIACGEMVAAAKSAGQKLEEKGISARVLDMYCIKPLDVEAVCKACQETGAIVTVEEHSIIGGMGAAICRIAAACHPVPIATMGLPDEPVIAGNSREIFTYYGLNADGIIKTVQELIK